ncbi:hypothetical protein PF005_g378 [Phytophthora fragariae]|uniref:Uncharacterized protein n=1 Tax=Phytophthora fragariae TaxID=53985 RepID=A0A6A3LQ85_9STRA|nr:hypothetical protein PF003_g9787 [Phytophthora fragariae]KAE8950092.1 hypothetical protein PF009_g379 [Phytophthora fragariae]KAE9020237.1 hypothetical protein PF011_g5506 [Phytophthora fragariae]KAE9139446.1 hypothetical protein PF007_g1019 [Phytophthora fragariae]KAE9139999.1 hypothetical protein PF010_g370 [Phytophthora fragariae]
MEGKSEILRFFYEAAVGLDYIHSQTKACDAVSPVCFANLG